MQLGVGSSLSRIITYLLTYSIVQSPSWEANWFAAKHEILCISRNPKVHYRTHKHPPPVPILGQPNPHPTSWRSILILSTHLRPWPLSLRFPHQDPIHPPLLTHTQHAVHPVQKWRLQSIQGTHLVMRYKPPNSARVTPLWQYVCC